MTFNNEWTYNLFTHRDLNFRRRWGHSLNPHYNSCPLGLLIHCKASDNLIPCDVLMLSVKALALLHIASKIMPHKTHAFSFISYSRHSLSHSLSHSPCLSISIKSVKNWVSVSDLVRRYYVWLLCLEGDGKGGYILGREWMGEEDEGENKKLTGENK